MKTGTIVIITALLFFPISLMILPFPYGFVVTLFLIIIGIVLRRKKPSTISGRTQNDDTMFFGCPRCGGNTQIISEKQYCVTCKIYL